jgi:hypothetical protein
MNYLTWKSTCFARSNECSKSFKALKQVFTTMAILQYFDYNYEMIVKTNGCDYVSTSILSQYDDDGILHPITIFSKKHTLAEWNYDIYDKELIAIVRASEEWRPQLQGMLYPNLGPKQS